MVSSTRLSNAVQSCIQTIWSGIVFCFYLFVLNVFHRVLIILVFVLFKGANDCTFKQINTGEYTPSINKN